MLLTVLLLEVAILVILLAAFISEFLGSRRP
jgi:hypothetical protein